MNEKNTPDLAKLYTQLGVVLDGLWYIEAEKRLGFEKAYEIDEAVWSIYPNKEAKRIKTFLGFEKPSAEDIQKALSLSLFNQTLSYDIIVKSEKPLILQFFVDACKSYSGMQKIGRPPDQIYKICKGIGLVFFKSFLAAYDPQVEVKCIFCPHGNEKEQNPGNDHICGWEFLLPNL